mmetsp:Transcript_77551/g.122444  ORF Transcript_77551/g.122444 Transcript_77551/m.122444 type:complete len:84 (-) Transcript_77551:62-313(-)
MKTQADTSADAHKKTQTLPRALNQKKKHEYIRTREPDDEHSDTYTSQARTINTHAHTHAECAHSSTSATRRGTTTIDAVALKV